MLLGAHPLEELVELLDVDACAAPDKLEAVLSEGLVGLSDGRWLARRVAYADVGRDAIGCTHAACERSHNRGLQDCLADYLAVRGAWTVVGLLLDPCL